MYEQVGARTATDRPNFLLHPYQRFRIDWRKDEGDRRLSVALHDSVQLALREFLRLYGASL